MGRCRKSSGKGQAGGGVSSVMKNTIYGLLSNTMALATVPAGQDRELEPAVSIRPVAWQPAGRALRR